MLELKIKILIFLTSFIILYSVFSMKDVIGSGFLYLGIIITLSALITYTSNITIRIVSLDDLDTYLNSK